MKRQKLIDRVAFVLDRQDELMKTARAVGQADGNGVAPYAREQARRDLLRAAVAFGLACQRYLGGRTDG